MKNNLRRWITQYHIYYKKSILNRLFYVLFYQKYAVDGSMKTVISCYRILDICKQI